MNISSNLTYSHTPVFEKINGAFRLYSHNNTDRYAKDTVLEAGDPQMLFENVLKSIRDAGYQLEDVTYDYFALDHETMAEEFMLLDKTGETVRKGFPYTLAVMIFRKTKRGIGRSTR